MTALDVTAGELVRALRALHTTEAQVKQLRAAIVFGMGQEGRSELEVEGQRVHLVWTTSVRGITVEALRKELPDADQYLKMEVDADRLKTDYPDLYRRLAHARTSPTVKVETSRAERSPRSVNPDPLISERTDGGDKGSVNSASAEKDLSGEERTPSDSP